MRSRSRVLVAARWSMTSPTPSRVASAAPTTATVIRVRSECLTVAPSCSPRRARW
ncbi:hypothetical protein G5V59_16785 [Nocardioides sp. W3-2-3]|nr:hypothetical protein [Nocardioides convexus]